MSVLLYSDPLESAFQNWRTEAPSSPFSSAHINSTKVLAPSSNSQSLPFSALVTKGSQKTTEESSRRDWWLPLLGGEGRKSWLLLGCGQARSCTNSPSKTTHPSLLCSAREREKLDSCQFLSSTSLSTSLVLNIFHISPPPESGKGRTFYSQLPFCTRPRKVKEKRPTNKLQANSCICYKNHLSLSHHLLKLHGLVFQ